MVLRFLPVEKPVDNVDNSCFMSSENGRFFGFM